MMAKLAISGLCKHFGSVEALRDIDVTIEEGEFVSILGASGCGKSTLLRMVDGLIEPSEGSLLIDSQPVTGPGHDRAFVFQQDRLLPWRTIEDNLAFGLQLRGQRKKEARSHAPELLALVGLEGFAKRYPHELSGGMRQRANIARALAVDPDVLLMDEPFAALDWQTREIMQSELTRIWQERQKTVLFVTHQIDEAVYLSDRIVILTPRPGQVKAVVTIDIPRPRTLETKRSPEFGRIVDQVWSLIEQEVRESMALELSA
jgi:NitT/TauT family transport system ATP-binding protein